MKNKKMIGRAIAVLMIFAMFIFQTPIALADIESVEITADNTAVVENSVETEASTGGNVVSLKDPAPVSTSTPDVLATTTESVATATSSLPVGTSTIETGDAYALSSAINIVNVNVANSDAFFAFISRFGSGEENVDLRDALFAAPEPQSCESCVTATTSLSAGETIQSSNTASIDNEMIVRSSTGSNSASGNNTLIETGNAYASAEVLNVANANFVDSTYVMLIFNSYGGLTGDLVLPNSSFFENFLIPREMSASTPALASVNASSTAEISNSADVSADTGGNLSSGTASSSVQTGNAYSGSSVINNINQNFIGGSSVALVFRVLGNWNGKVFNLPSSFMINGTPVGVSIIGGDDAPFGVGDGLSVSSKNEASISNGVSVSASTGGNVASSTNSSEIRTGDAYASASIVNVANTNIIGRNWMQAIINIFGDWDGNVSFGQPDLWVGTKADFAGSSNGPDADLTFTYTIKNNGDAPAHDVVLSHEIGSSLISFLSGGQDGTENIGTLLPGEIKEIKKTARVASSIPAGNTSVANSIALAQTETDGNTGDNSDALSVTVYRSGGSSYYVAPSTEYFDPSGFLITKTNSATTTMSASTTVDYTINIKNNGSDADHAVLVDTISNIAGEIIHREEWDLGRVYAGEEISVSYTVFYSASTTPGVYTNRAYIKSAVGTFENSMLASSPVSISVSAPNILPAEKEKKILPSLVLREPRAVSKIASAEVSTTSASTTIAHAFYEISDTASDPSDRRLLAGVFEAVGNLPWYAYLLIILVLAAIYIAYRNRKKLPIAWV